MADLVSIPTSKSRLPALSARVPANLGRYLELDGYKAVQKALAMEPDAIINEVKNSGFAGVRCRILYRDEVVVRTKQSAKPNTFSVTVTRASLAPAKTVYLRARSALGGLRAS